QVVAARACSRKKPESETPRALANFFLFGRSLNSNLAVLVFFVMNNPQFSLWDTRTVRTKNARPLMMADGGTGVSGALCYKPRMALKVVRGKSTGAWTISGTINGVRVQKRAQSNNKRRAEEEAAALETAMLREDWHGPRPAAKTIGQAMVSYAEAVDR